MKGNDFIFHYANLLHCKCHKINQNRGGSYIDSSDWIKNKQATLNFFTVIVALNHLRNWTKFIKNIKN